MRQQLCGSLFSRGRTDKASTFGSIDGRARTGCGTSRRCVPQRPKPNLLSASYGRPEGRPLQRIEFSAACKSLPVKYAPATAAKTPYSSWRTWTKFESFHFGEARRLRDSVHLRRSRRTAFHAGLGKHFPYYVGYVLCRGTPPVGNSLKCVRACWCGCSGALLRGDGSEGRPALFYLVTTAVRAGGLFRVMLGDGQDLRECLLAGVAEKVIVGHRNLHGRQPGTAFGIQGENHFTSICA